MIGNSFIHNGVLKDINEAHISLGDINYAYGYGVYETLKVRKNHIFFIHHHAQRLLESARILAIDHSFSATSIADWITQLVAAHNYNDANVKAMLIGNSTGTDSANLYILLLNPLYPPRHLYQKGAHTITVQAERIYPQAKSLNMLASVMAYRDARRAGAYDALMVNRNHAVTEGTRSNLFATDGTSIYIPPHADTLAGVTKHTLVQCIENMGINVITQELPLAHLSAWKGLFLTSTSAKIIPVATVDSISFAIPQIVREIMQAYNAYLNSLI